MSNMFDLSEKELKEAKSGGRPDLKHGEEYTFLVDEVKEHANDKGNQLIVGCKIVGGDHDGSKWTHFLNDNPMGKGLLVKMLQCFYSDEEITGGGLSPASLVTRSFKSVAKITSKADKSYTNFYDFVEASDVPAGLSPAAGADVPF